MTGEGLSVTSALEKLKSHVLLEWKEFPVDKTELQVGWRELLSGLENDKDNLATIRGNSASKAIIALGSGRKKNITLDIYRNDNPEEKVAYWTTKGHKLQYFLLNAMTRKFDKQTIGVFTHGPTLDLDEFQATLVVEKVPTSDSEGVVLKIDKSGIILDKSTVLESREYYKADGSNSGRGINKINLNFVKP